MQADISALVDTALSDWKKEGDELERALGITRLYEEIALQAEIDEHAISAELVSPERQARFFGLIAHGAAAIGGLLLRSVEAEEQGDELAREQLDELGSRLQSVTMELARLSKKGADR